MRSRAEFATALVLQLLGGGVALLLASRHWQTAHVLRTRPLADQSFGLSGRNLDSAPTALAVVALVGVVAVLAVRGQPRRVIGAVVALVGVGLVWRSLQHLSAVSLQRAFALHGGERNVDLGSALPGSHVAAHPAWGVLSALAGLLVLAAGALLAARGHRWAGLGSRYDAPGAGAASRADAQTERTRADASLWKALDDGDDPTART